MKILRDYIEESIKSIHAQPVHGKHSDKDAGIVSIHAQPVHGKHSQVKSDRDTSKYTKESFDPMEKAHWYNDHENNHIASDHTGVHDHINPTNREWKSSPHSEHLENYSTASNSLNSELISRDKGEFPSHYYQKHIDGLDSHLAKTSLPHDHMYVYHGTHTWNPKEHLNNTVDNTVHIPTYLSTSIHKKTAGSFAGINDADGQGRHIIRIKVHKGQKGQYLGSHSSYPEEHEYLMPRGQKLKFHPDPKIVHDHYGPVHIWDAHAIQDKEHHNKSPEPEHNQSSFDFGK